MPAPKTDTNGAQSGEMRVVCEWDDSFSDGCTLAPHRIKIARFVIDWRDACVQHDRDHWYGGTAAQHVMSHVNLARNMIACNPLLMPLAVVYFSVVLLSSTRQIAQIVNPVLIHLGSQKRIDWFWGFGQRRHRKFWSERLETRVARHKLRYMLRQPDSPSLAEQ